MEDATDNIEEVEAEVINAVEPTVETRTVRLVQFIFDSKMVELEVDWTSQQLIDSLDKVMADDGYLWVPIDEERDTGMFVNFNNVTNIKLLEIDVPTNPEPAEAPPEFEQDIDEPPLEERVPNYLDKVSRRHGLPTDDAATQFYAAMLLERFWELEGDMDRATGQVESWLASREA